jgi:hypothetical protein
MTAKPPGRLASTVGFSPRRADPMRFVRQSVTSAIYATWTGGGESFAPWIC